MNIKIQQYLIYFSAFFCAIHCPVWAKPKLVLLGLQGTQAQKIRQNLHRALEKNKNIILKPLNFMQVSTQNPVIAQRRQRQKKDIIHKNLSEAKKKYQNLEFQSAKDMLAEVLEDYQSHLFTQDIVDGLATAYFYQGLTYLALGKKEKAIESMLEYQMIQGGIINQQSTLNHLSKKFYAPDIQTLFTQSQDAVTHQALASLNIVSKKPIEKLWINGVGLAPSSLDQLKLYAGQHYILLMDKKAQPLFSSEVTLKEGQNIISVQPSTQSKNKEVQAESYFNWDRQNLQLRLDNTHKQALTRMALDYNIDIFIFLSSGAKGVYVSFFDERNRVLLPAIVLKQPQDILHFSEIAIGENGYLNKDIDMTMLQRRRWSSKQ